MNINLEKMLSRLKNYSSLQRDAIAVISTLAFILIFTLLDLHYSGIACLIVFLLLALYFVSQNLVFLFRYLLLGFAAVANLVGVAVCEYTVIELGELRTFSSFAGSLPLLCFGWSLLLVTVYFVDRFLSAKMLRVSEHPSRLFKYLVLVSLGIMFLSFMQIVSKPAFSMGIDRFAYNEMVVSELPLAAYSKFIPYFAIIPAIAFRYKETRHISLLSLITYFAYLVWTGTKFGDYFTCFAVFLAVNSDAVSYAASKLGRILTITFLGICIAGLVGIAVFFTNSFGYARSSHSFLAERLAQQGQLWWSTYKSFNGKNHVDDFNNELEAIISGGTDISESVGADYAVYKIMYLSAPREVVDAKLSSGSRYSEAGFAAAFYYFGFTGVVVFSIAMGALGAVFLTLIVFFGSSAMLIPALVGYRLFSIYLTSLAMFTFWDLFDPVSIISYFVIATSIFTLERLRCSDESTACNE